MASVRASRMQLIGSPTRDVSTEDAPLLSKAINMHATLQVKLPHIVANRPGMAGIVLVVCTLSRLCPGRGKIVLMSRNISSGANSNANLLASRALCNLNHSSIVVLMAMKSLITAVWTWNLLMNCYASARKLR